jgi:hypothetical protein
VSSVTVFTALLIAPSSSGLSFVHGLTSLWAAGHLTQPPTLLTAVNLESTHFYILSTDQSTFFKLICWVRHRPPVPAVSWWRPLKWVYPLQPSIRSAGQSFFSFLRCCCSSRGCNMGLLWFPSLSWWFILFPWMTSLMIGTFRSSCRVWLVTYQVCFAEFW